MGRMRVASLCLILATSALTLVAGQGQGQASNFSIADLMKLPIYQQILTGNWTSQLPTNFIQSLLQTSGNSTTNSTGTPGGPMLPKILNALPDLMKNPYFRQAVTLAVDEVGRAQPGDAAKATIINSVVQKTGPSKMFTDEFNNTVQQDMYQYTLTHTNWLRVVNRLAMSMSVRDLLTDDPAKPTVNPQCYNDTMDFLDSLIGTHLFSKDPRDVSINRPWWALKMFDSFGKPSSGILKGGLHYVGSYEQCMEVHAYLPKDLTLQVGGKPHDHDTEFDTRYCRVSFNLPDSVVSSFGDTRGLALRLSWGMCFPDSCHSQDVVAMFRLGQLQPLNLGVHNVYCVEDKDVGDDASAVIAIVFLSMLVGAVVLCTLIEAAIIFYNNNIARPGSTPTNSTVEDAENQFPDAEINVAFDNAAFQPDDVAQKNEAPEVVASAPAPAPFSAASKQAEAVKGLGYIHHKEDAPVFNDKDARPVALSPPADVVTRNDVPRKTESPPPSYTKAVRGSGKDHEKRVPKLVQVFSLLTNMPKLLNGKRSPKAIHCLHGIRFFSLMWVVLGHTYNYGLVSTGDPSTNNILDAEKIFQRFTFEGVMAGGFSVDTFFMLSGLLVTWLTLRDMGKKNSVSYWVMFYVHRFWRLTPLYMIVLMTFTCLHTYLGGGPLWPDDLSTASNCKKYWWTNFLYVNNLVHVDDMCMGWTWYLSNDMQFYWISPLFLLPLFYFAPLGLMMTVGLLCGGIAAAFYFEHKNGGDVLSMMEDGSEYWKQVYIVPWCRVAAYTVGMLLGYIFFKVKQTTLKMRTAVIGWVLTWAVGLFLCYIPYTYRKEGGEKWDRWEEALFESFGRPLWAACVAWIVFACHNNRGGFINSILSWQGFLPLSRLTYAAYLVHPVVMMLHVLSMKTVFYIDDFNLVYLFLGHAVIAFLTAFFASLIAEAPALAFEKLVFRLH